MVYVCPTSHLDWDWVGTFAEYVQIPTQNQNYPEYADGAVSVLESACQVLDGNSTFCFSLAEIGFLRAFLVARPGRLKTVADAGPERFALLGGGITSPDNLVCHGEVFIRNYLLGRRWLKSVGLAKNVTPVAWLPDTFGHDPQLPVVLEAMGLHWVGLSRVPGSPQPFANHPFGGGLSVAEELDRDGLVFGWVARDGSRVVAHFMPATYGAIWDGSGQETLQGFVDMGFGGWPSVGGAPLLLATAGGDWALSAWQGGNWVTFIADYNAVYQPPLYPVALPKTFPQFMEQVGDHTGRERSPLLAQNYWTGIFATRPRLKALHNRAAQLALAAEVAATLARVTSNYSSAGLDGIDDAITRAWEALVPSSHHDYITGTSSDRVYLAEQLPLLELAVRLARQCLDQAVALIAMAVTASPAPGEVPVVVFNPLGFGRGGVVELPAGAVPRDIATVTCGPMTGQVQPLRGGGLLFYLPEVVGPASFGYTTAVLHAGEVPPNPPPPPSDVVTLDSGVVTATIDRSAGWAITALRIGTMQVLVEGGFGNSIRVYNDAGNLYQFGNEPLSDEGDYGEFADSGTIMTGSDGEWLEWGPVRWHFRATIHGEFNGAAASYTLDYLLNYGEPVLHMRLTGAALGDEQNTGTSILTTFDLGHGDGADYDLIYGTANHYEDSQPVAYWPGPTFRATHDFVHVTGGYGPGLAIYHQGVPAWSINTESGQLLGALLRNPVGTQRGACGSDTAVHTVEYAVGSAGLSPVPNGEALKMALTVTNPLVGAVVAGGQPLDGEVTLPQQACLANVTQPGILRVARPQAGHALASIPGYYSERMSFILRLYMPYLVADGVTITLPSLPDPGIGGYSPDVTWEEVTALEEPVARERRAAGVAGRPSAGSSGMSSWSVDITPERALTTLRLSLNRWPTVPAS
jgi:alpha-mannosidase